MKMFSFVEKVFVLGLAVLSSSITGALSCASINNQECKVRSEIVDINSNNPIFHLFSVEINRCSGNCNSINDPYAKTCVPDIVKNLNVKVFNLMSRTNETKSIKLHENCKCICRLNKIICNNKQRWNNNQCRCECKELIDKGLCDKGYIFNPSNCKCECDKWCNTSQYLDYSDCKCKKKIIDRIVEKCIEYDDDDDDDDKTKLVNITVTKNNNQTKLVNMTVTKNDNKTKIVNKTVENSCKVYIILTIVAIVISTVYSIYFVYYNWVLIKNKDFFNKYNTRRETLI